MRINLRKSLFILPNLFTLSSVFCGFVAIALCTSGATDKELYRASLLIIFAIFFDTIDGRVARLTRTQSAFGLQIDSLADVISFGVAPGLLVYRWALEPLGAVALLACFGFVACAAIRLARFNVQTMTPDGRPIKPGKYMNGLPTPGAAGILVSLVLANHAAAGNLSNSPLPIFAVVVALSFFMVSTIKFRSFKDLRMSWRTVLLVTVAIGSSAWVALRYHVTFALIWLLSSYVAVGLIETIITLSARVIRQRRLHGHTEDQKLRPS